VLERYFKYEDAGDQFVGRVIAGLPVNTSKFSVLPPHFVDLESSCVKRGIQTMFPALSTVPQLSSILYLLLASLVYHFDFLHSTLPADHAFRFTPLFTEKDLLSSLRNVLVSGYESPYLVATGIPPHVEVYKLLEKNERSISTMPTLIMNGIAQVIEDKGVKAGHITRDILESVLKSALSKICPTSSQESHDTAPPIRPTHANTIPVFSWGGKFHKLPDNFKFPSVDVFTAWKLWWCGIPSTNIIPFCQINVCDLKTQAQKNTFYKWKSIMLTLTKYFNQQTGQTLDKSPNESGIIDSFRVAQGGLDGIRSGGGGKRVRRIDQLKVTTAARLLQEIGSSNHQQHPIDGNPKQSKISRVS